MNSSKVLNERWDQTQNHFCCSQTFIFAHGCLHISHFRRGKPGTPRLPVWSARLALYRHEEAFPQPAQTQGYGDAEALIFKCEQAQKVTESLTVVGKKEELAPPAALHIVTMIPIVAIVKLSWHICVSCGFDTQRVLHCFHSQVNFIALQFSSFNSYWEKYEESVLV